MNYQSGVYAIVFPHGKRYIGSAVSFTNRWRDHRNSLRRNAHRNQILQHAFNKYDGKIQFVKLLVCAAEHVVMYEQIFLDVFQPEYNICKIAGNTKGYRHSDETKRVISKHSKAQKRAPRTAAQREVISKAKKGKSIAPRTAEHEAKLADSRRGRKASSELRLKLSLAHVGHKHSPETRAKMSASHARNRTKNMQVESNNTLVLTNAE